MPPTLLMRASRRILRPLRDGLDRMAPLKHRSSAQNIYHCCVHKTGSQWILGFLADRLTHRWSGLNAITYQDKMEGGTDARKITERRFDIPFPEGVIVSPIYIDYAGYDSIPKPPTHKAFFVMRDPRDITISMYFSMRYSHASVPRVDKLRPRLAALDERDGIAHMFDYLRDFGLYAALRSWAEAGAGSPDVLATRYEDFIGPDRFQAFRRLFDHCGIPIPDAALSGLIQKYSFEEMAGRQRGQEDVKSHLRKGIAGDWRNHFDDDLTAKFKEKTGDLAEVLGYGW